MAVVALGGAAEYRRRVESGALGKYLVDAPTDPMTRGSKIPGSSLIAFGLLLLALVFVGFFS